MKKNTVKVFVTGFMLTAVFSAGAQTAAQKKKVTEGYDIQALHNLASEFKAKWDKDYAEAVRLAEINGWPLSFEKDGNYSSLVGLMPDGVTPKYYQTLNANAAFTSGVNTLYANGGLGLSLTGAGFNVGVWDQLRPRVTHFTFDGRFQPFDLSTAIAMHPTHVGGTVLGSGIGSTNLNARGMAYEASGVSYDWNNDVAEMTLEAEYGLLVSNHSYGLNSDYVAEFPWMWGAYSSDSRAFDQIAFTAKNYLIVKAAGNDRNEGYNMAKGGYDLINHEATSKNVLVVAAVQGLNQAYTNPSQVVMSNFSSWGPTDDRRIKPDISAKGVGVLSSTDASNSSYGSSSGTSMAAPVVAGGAILLQQLYYQLQEVPDEEKVPMRSATLKGLICHTAHEAGDANGPDPMFGWGLFSAEKAAQALLNQGSTSIIDERTKANGSGDYTINVMAENPNLPLQVSISWTDPAGVANSGAVDSPSIKLVNNLDVRVEQGEVDYYPWRLTANNGEAAEQGVNNVDNMERVDIYNPSGQYTIRVSHQNNISQGPQQYTLIVTNASQVLSTNDNDAPLFSVWPNPANTEVNINLVDGTDGTAVFYDVQGREVLSAVLTQASTRIDTATLSGGIYMVKVAQAGKQQVKKVVVNK
jgi:serine protease AprX